MYTLERLFTDAVKNRGPVLKRSADDGGYGGYRRVWDAFNRYVTEAVSKQQTVNVQNFCKIGYKVEDTGKEGQSARRRPHFQLAENFIKSCGLDVRLHPVLTDKQLTSIEEFNFSKAAIRHSQNLTKENVFMGLRGLVHQLGEAIANGQSLSIAFEVGTLTSTDRDVRFNFSADLYANEGLNAPEGSIQASDYKPSVSFGPPSKDALTLKLTGGRNLQSSAGRSVQADHLGGWAEDESMVSASDKVVGDPYAPMTARSDLGSNQELYHSAVSGTPAAMSAREKVAQSFLDRHLKDIQKEAVEVKLDRAAWEAHVERSAAEEKKDHDWRKAMAIDHSDQLKVQMHHAEHRRQEGRQHTIQQASQHDFPNFREQPEAGVLSYVKHRRDNLKDDLDQQVTAKQRVQQAAKERDRRLEAHHAESCQRELAALKYEAHHKRESDRTTLKQEWAKDSHLKNVKKKITDFHKAPPSRTDDFLSDMNRGLMSTPSGGSNGASLGYGGSYSDGGATPMSARSRPTTGSVRRMPIGAAASLALQKQKLAESLRR